MIVREYSLKFVKLSRHATFLAYKCKDEMSRIVIGINRDLEVECRSAMLYDNMDLARLMVHVKQVEVNHKNRGIRDARSPKPQD